MSDHSDLAGPLATAMRIKLAASAILSSVVAAIALPLIMGGLERGLARVETDLGAIPELAVWAMTNRWLIAAIALLGAVAGVVGLVSRRSGLAFALLGLLWAIGAVAFAVYAIVSLLGPLYQYQPLG